jgi:hypothetical protein
MRRAISLGLWEARDEQLLAPINLVHALER